MVVDAGTPNVVSRSFFGTRVDVLADEIQQATSDRAGDRARVTIYIYALKTYLPVVSQGPHVFDFVVGRPVSYIDEDDAARILREEIDWLLASPWTEPHAAARQIETSTPERIAVSNLEGTWFRVGSFAHNMILVDGNRRFSFALGEAAEPVVTRGECYDLAECLQRIRW